MKDFLYKTGIFSLIVMLSFLGILSMAGGYTDAFYVRFTTPRQDNLILGTSRAAQGIQPKALNGILNRNFFNYAFTVDYSPYGPVYYESIKKKLNKEVSDGVFIVTIDPWSISSLTEDPNDSTNFREADLMLANTSNVNVKPNFSYLINNLQGEYYAILLTPLASKNYLHSDGWLEISVSMDSVLVDKRRNVKLKAYNEFLRQYKFSSFRLEYLEKTIKYLNEYGSVYLVRLPIHSEILEIENKLMPDFERKIENVVSLAQGYFDMTDMNAEFSYTDGNHLYKESGVIVSEKIADWIRENRWVKTTRE